MFVVHLFDQTGQKFSRSDLMKLWRSPDCFQVRVAPYNCLDNWHQLLGTLFVQHKQIFTFHRLSIYIQIDWVSYFLLSIWSGRMKTRYVAIPFFSWHNRFVLSLCDDFGCCGVKTFQYKKLCLFSVVFCSCDCKFRSRALHVIK